MNYDYIFAQPVELACFWPSFIKYYWYIVGVSDKWLKEHVHKFWVSLSHNFVIKEFGIQQMVNNKDVYAQQLHLFQEQSLWGNPDLSAFLKGTMITVHVLLCLEPHFDKLSDPDYLYLLQIFSYITVLYFYFAF